VNLFLREPLEEPEKVVAVLEIAEVPNNGMKMAELYPATFMSLGWSPVEVIYPSSSQSHAMRTQETPMLVFAAWLESGSRSAINI